ncbi:MAG TPA: MCE family protein, partial [Pseudonocardia sp.]
MIGRNGRLALALASAVVLGAGLAGCGVNASDLAVPVGGVPGPSYRLSAVFSDALNLPEGAHVRLNGDDIGRVQRIVGKDFTATVTMSIRKDVPLPVGTTVELRQATPLGEVFVAVHPPARPVTGAVIADGTVLGEADTAPSATIEDLLAALSVTVNGGGLAQLQTIVHELNTGVDGKAAKISHLLGQTQTALDTINSRTSDIDRVLASSRQLTQTLTERRSTVDAAFSDITPMVRVLADQNNKFIHTLDGAGELAHISNRALDKSDTDIRLLVSKLGPLGTQFAETKPVIKPALTGLINFTDTLAALVKGDGAASDAAIDLLQALV